MDRSLVSHEAHTSHDGRFAVHGCGFPFFGSTDLAAPFIVSATVLATFDAASAIADCVTNSPDHLLGLLCAPQSFMLATMAHHQQARWTLLIELEKGYAIVQRAVIDYDRSYTSHEW